MNEIQEEKSLNTAQKNNIFSIYKITNINNDKSYIGLTTRTLKERKKEHITHARANIRQYSIYHAIRKYGEASFNWEVIDQTDNKESLQELEKQYIEKYDTYYNGYNQTKGGEGGELPEEIRRIIGDKNAIPVTQLHVDTLEILNQFKGAAHAGRALNISNDDITRVCRGKTVLGGGYRWCYTTRVKEYILDHPITPIYHNKKEVVQLDQDSLEVLNTFISAAEAQIQTGFDFRDISGVCNDAAITTGGYRWCFKSKLEEYLLNPPDGSKIRQKTIYMLDPKTFEILNEYRGATEAHRATGLGRSAINKALCGAVVIAKGYRWCFKTEYDKYVSNPPTKKPFRRVRQIDIKTKETICDFDSAREASNKTGVRYGSIKDTCRGRQKTGAGYIWEYLS